MFHRREFGRYIEIFGGSGAVLLGKEPSKFEVYNDIEGELVNFFRIVKNRPAELLLELDLLPLNSREEFVSWLHFHDGGNEPNIHLADQLEIIDRTTPTSLTEEAEKLKTSLRKRSDYRDVRQAAAYLMRVRNSYSSSGRSFACQPFNVRTLFTQIWEMSRRLENVIIEQQSFEVLIPHYDREDSFFYGDPPYYDSEYVYDAEFGWDHHVLLRDTLAKCKGKWLHSKETSKVLTPALESVISGRIGDTENRIARVLFKQSVELAMLMHVVAATHAVRPEDLDNLRKMCVGEVSKINGKISFEDAVKLQKK